MKKIAIIGSGFSGLSAAAYTAQKGHEVHLFEKNSTPGGRARQFSVEQGYHFDMGPSWYWMPDLFEQFFADFGKRREDMYELINLDPQFDMVFDDRTVSIPSSYEELKDLFESLEPGSAVQLDKFMAEAQYKYEVGMQEFVNKPCHSWFEFMSLKIVKSAFKLDLLTDFRSHVRKHFKNPKLVSLMEFPVLFLGAMPDNIPALYSLMNYGGLKLGTWYPMGGFIKIIEAMQSIAEELGVVFHFDADVSSINVEDGQAESLTVNGVNHYFDAIIASSDYHHTEQKLLKPEYRNYTEEYWDKKTFAPSCLIYYLGIKGTVENIKHHSLFFEHSLDNHAVEIYKTKVWPEKPLFYVCCPSKTDATVAPEGNENIFLLMPVAPGIEDNESIRETYFKDMITRLEKQTSTKDLLSRIEYKKGYCINDFMSDYNAYKGNAYGLANTLMQTAVLKPSLRNKKISNLLYTGQLTVPGPGVPPSLISGKIAAEEVHKIKTKRHEAVI